MAWQWFGNAAHLCVGNRCRFHLATLVGKYVVSTVGEWHRNDEDKKPTEIGLRRLYETMVFKAEGACQCGCGLPSHSGQEVEMRGYNTAKDATAGHAALCGKWSRRKR